MSQRVVKLENFSEVLEDFSHLHITNIRKGVVSGIAKSIPDLVRASPVDTGLYAQSWNFTADEMSATIGNTAPHAAIIEFGARPFTPPIKPLLEWAKRVLNDSSQPPEYSTRVRSLAFATQKKISQQGMKPRHILTDMIPEIIENIKQELAALG